MPVTAAARGEFVRFEVESLTASGAALWVDFSLKPVKDAHGAVQFLGADEPARGVDGLGGHAASAARMARPISSGIWGTTALPRVSAAGRASSSPGGTR